MLVVPAIGRQRQEDHQEFEASLDLHSEFKDSLNYSKTLSQNKKMKKIKVVIFCIKTKGFGPGFSSVALCLPRKHKALSLIPSTEGTKTKKRGLGV